MRERGPKHFSMIHGFHVADFFTLANAACGVGAVLLTMLYLQSEAWRHQHSALGRELDSLSDVISFGVAPAALAYAAGWTAAGTPGECETLRYRVPPGAVLVQG